MPDKPNKKYTACLKILAKNKIAIIKSILFTRNDAMNGIKANTITIKITGISALYNSLCFLT